LIIAEKYAGAAPTTVLHFSRRSARLELGRPRGEVPMV
jgi:hypothetical protein